MPNESTQQMLETMNGGTPAYRVTDPEDLKFREAEGDAPELNGRMMPYNEWTEIKSRVEGHFMERFAPGSLTKTMNEQVSRMRILWQHGRDALLGKQAIADIIGLDDADDGARYRASLLDGLPALIVSGLRRGLYGSSITFEPVKWDRMRFPTRSEHNPDGLEERTVREASVREISVVTFPQYAGATAHVRSLTDEMVVQQLLGDPKSLLALLAQVHEPAEPQHSEREEPEDQALEPSRSTQPVHDYLRPEEDDSSWRL